MTNRNSYYRKIFIYKKRREKYRDEYNGTLAIYKTERYLHLTKKISQWQKEIKRLDVRKDKIAALLKSINAYFNVRVQDRVRNQKHDLARKIYFKVGLELNICGTHLARFIGRKHYDIASYNRTSLIKSFATNERNKEAFYNFKSWQVQE